MTHISYWLKIVYIFVYLLPICTSSFENCPFNGFAIISSIVCSFGV
jgi:hypothetical protein